MTNEEAKALYQNAMEEMQRHNFEDALKALDTLDRERPNSRHVLHSRAVCLLALQRYEEALECCERLNGRLEPERLAELRAKIVAAQEQSGSRGRSNAADTAASSSAGHSAERNVLIVESVVPGDVNETAVIARIQSGIFRVGDRLRMVSPEGLPIEARILRLGPAETPLKIARAGQRLAVLLQVEPTKVVPGSTAVAESEEEAYAATMVVQTESSSTAESMELSQELREIQRLYKAKRYAEACERVADYLKTNPGVGAAHALAAHIYLDEESPVRDSTRALDHARHAYSLGGSLDPHVVNLLAEALAAQGEGEQGLRYLERLYLMARSPEIRDAVVKRIHEFRQKHGLGQIWEFADSYGEVVFEAHTEAEVVKALQNGVIKSEHRVRVNRVGEWQPFAQSAWSAHPEVGKIMAGKNEISQTRTNVFVWLLALLVALSVALLIVFF